MRLNTQSTAEDTTPADFSLGARNTVVTNPQNLGATPTHRLKADLVKRPGRTR